MSSYDPGPVPLVVEPETVGNVTTIAVTPRAWVHITEDIGCSGCTGLTVELATGEHITVPLPPAAVDVTIAALRRATPVPYLLTEGR